MYPNEEARCPKRNEIQRRADAGRAPLATCSMRNNERMFFDSWSNPLAQHHLASHLNLFLIINLTSAARAEEIDATFVISRANFSKAKSGRSEKEKSSFGFASDD